jgi:UDP-glucose 4-epimerase
VLLTQAIRLLGRASIPVIVPLVAPLASAVRRLGVVDFPTDQLRLLLYGRVADTTQLLERFGYRPRYSTREALLDFARGRELRRLVSTAALEDWERDVYAFLRRKNQERFERARGS